MLRGWAFHLPSFARHSPAPNSHAASEGQSGWFQSRTLLVMRCLCSKHRRSEEDTPGLSFHSRRCCLQPDTAKRLPDHCWPPVRTRREPALFKPSLQRGSLRPDVCRRSTVMRTGLRRALAVCTHAHPARPVPEEGVGAGEVHSTAHILKPEVQGPGGRLQTPGP